MIRRCCGLAVALLVASIAVVQAQEEIFSDGFEWGSICAWDNDRWHLDFDEDLFGDWADPGLASDCPPPLGSVDNNLDCDDGDGSVHPGAPEICNGGDDDCDTFVDEGELCSTGLSCCDGGCADLDEDETHCGFCGNFCLQDDMCCEGGCTPVETDPFNCGFCGNACDLMFTSVHECINGHCAIGECDTGYDNCNSFHDDGCETPILTDPDNCGACGAGCDLPNTATHWCSQGECAPATCDFGFGDCNPLAEDGCETPILVDVNNCGQCGLQCDLAHAEVSQCIDGDCRVEVCDPLWGNCDPSHFNGCETPLGSDVQNCGACGQVCPGVGMSETSVSCSGGECSFNCYGNRYDCNDHPNDACEIYDPPSSADHHVRQSSEYLGSFSCSDSSSDPDISDRLLSDRHSHSSVAGFDAATGSAPDWFRLFADGGWCTNDIELQLSVSSSSCNSCYRLRVETDGGLYFCDTSVSGTCTISDSVGAYSDDTNIYIRVSKTCSDAVCIEDVDYTVTGHL